MLRASVNTDIDNTAELLFTAADGSVNRPTSVLLTPVSTNTDLIYIGHDATVTADAAATGGTPVLPGGLVLDLLRGDAIWGIAAAANQKLRILVNGSSPASA